MVRGTPSTKMVQIILIGLNIWPPGGVGRFSYVNMDEAFLLSEISRPSKGETLLLWNHLV